DAVASAVETAPPIIKTQSNSVPAADLASISTPTAKLVADNSSTITSSRIADSAAIAKVTADSIGADSKTAPTFTSFASAPIIQLDAVASAVETAPPIIKTQSNSVPAADLASISTPTAKLVADNTPTITSSRIADSAAVAKVTTDSIGADSKTAPTFTSFASAPTIHFDSVALASDQSALANARPYTGLSSAELASLVKPLSTVPTDLQTTAQASDKTETKQQPQVIASLGPTEQQNLSKAAANSIDASQFNGRYVGPGVIAATSEQSSQPISTVRRPGSGLAREAANPGTNATSDTANNGKQFFALPGASGQSQLSAADSQLSKNIATMAKDGLTGKNSDTPIAALAVEGLKQLLGRQIQGEQTASGLAADALKTMIARQLGTETSVEAQTNRAAINAIEYKITTTNQISVGTSQIVSNGSLVDSRLNDSKPISTQDLISIRSTSLTAISETKHTGNAAQIGTRLGTTSDAQIAQSINVIVGIGTGATSSSDGKIVSIDGKPNLIDSRLTGISIPLPAEITDTKKTGETTLVITGKDVKSTDLIEPVGTKKGEAVKIGDLIAGEPVIKITTAKTGDKKDPAEEDEETIKNSGTIIGAGGFGGGAAGPTNDPNSQTTQSTVTGTAVDPDQKMPLPDLEIVDGSILPTGQKNTDDDGTANAYVVASSRVETENNIDTDKPHTHIDEIISVSNTADTNTPTNISELSEVDRLFGKTKNQLSDEDAAWQAGKRQAELLSIEHRRVYKIKRGDSLADIARRELGDVVYVQLLVEINIDTLTFDRYGQIILTPGREIYLPSRADMMRFLAYQEQENKMLLAFVDGKDIDTNQQVIYACRLGDTLVTVAKRHPAIRDARLWKLVAELNNLSTKKDKNGAPVARLQRGQHLLLPTAEQKSDYLHELAFGTKSRDLSSDFVHHITNDKVQEPKAKSTLGDKAITAEPDTSFKSRLVSQSDLGDTGDSLVLRLELLVDGKFVPVVEYAIGFGSATLCVHTKNGDSKVTNIDLPNRSARELAESDLAANTNLYCQNFENNVLPL
ncbi:MAG: LysM peptidoglycan-binding domain-containing protein, partial [Candidatus Obscuribacterales bacterium]|nr:LysM peptidoglycan-binding domain-containing protein [Candidatus Obscuribacterales bacterium]